MNKSEILNEFWRDYKNTIRYRLFGWVQGHSSEIKKKQNKKNPDWVKVKDTRIIRVGGNTYRCKIKAKIDPKKGAGFLATTYLITNDSTSGRSIVFLLPADENSNALIKYDSHFFYRYAELIEKKNSKLEEIIDRFMSLDTTFKARSSEELIGQDTNLQVELLPGVYGIGNCNLEDMTFEIKTCIVDEQVSNWKKETETEEIQPLMIYRAHKEYKKKLNEEKHVEEVREKTQKELEIEQAWKEYYGQL